MRITKCGVYSSSDTCDLFVKAHNQLESQKEKKRADHSPRHPQVKTTSNTSTVRRGAAAGARNLSLRRESAAHLPHARSPQVERRLVLLVLLLNVARKRRERVEVDLHLRSEVVKVRRRDELRH